MYRIAIFGLALTLAIVPVAHAVTPQTPSQSDAVIGCGIPDCNRCGEFLLSREAWVAAEVQFDDRQRQRVFCGPRCLLLQQQEWGERASLLSFRVLDYSTFSCDQPQLIDGGSAFYVVLEGKIEDAPALVGAFAVASQAQALADESGGEVLAGWEALVEQLTDAQPTS